MNYQKYYSNQIHSSSLLCQLAQMWRTQMLCDAVIKTGNVTTKAHRLVLVAACPMLQSMDNASIGSHLEVRLASEIKQDSINMFLQYLYEGFMLLTEDNVRDIEKMSRLLQVDSIIKCCADFNKSLQEKTGLPVYSASQYKYTSHDMLEFRHVRVSNIQKSLQDGAGKRSASEFSRPGSPGGKRQRMHHPGSPSLEGSSHRADDAQGMSDIYRSSHQPADPWDRVPRLGSGMPRVSGRNLQPGVVEIIEDSLELVQTEPMEKDPVTGRPIDSRPPVQKSVSISVASQVIEDQDLQIINVSSGDGGGGGPHHAPTASTNTTSTNSSRGSLMRSGDHSSSSGRGDVPISPRNSDRSYMMAGPSQRSQIQSQQQYQMEQQRQSQSQQSPFGGFGQIELEQVSHIPGLTKPKPPETHSTPKTFPQGPPMLQSKPFAAGSAHQVSSTGNVSSPQVMSSNIGQISIPPISPVMSESSPFSASAASPSNKINRTMPSSSASKSESVERPSSTDKMKDSSSKSSGTPTPITDDLTPDISIVKIESSQSHSDKETTGGDMIDTGGLDMYVDTHGDEGMPPQTLDDDNDQTYEGSDYDVEEPPGEGSNEGSNLSADQNSSWYMNTMKDDYGEDEDCMLVHSMVSTVMTEGIGSNISNNKSYLVGTRKRTIRDVKFIKEWLSNHGHPYGIEDMDESLLNSLLELFYIQVRTKENKPLTRSSLVGLRASLNRYLMSLTTGYKQWSSILKDGKFISSNSVLDQLQEEEKMREKTPKWKPILPEDLKKLMNSQTLSPNSARSLQRKVWIDLVLHFGIKGNKATWSLTKDSFILETDDKGMEYYTLNQDLEIPKHRRYSEVRDWYWNARMYRIPNSPICPVNSLKLYLSKLSRRCPDFFQRPTDTASSKMSVTDFDVWYRGALGHQVIMKIMSEISKDACLRNTYTNTCVRATLVDLLAKRGADLEGMYTRSLTPYTSDELMYNSNSIHEAFYNDCY